MLGVVVWSNEKRSKAVIWCEDQGALAYLEGLGNLAPAAAWPAAGDLVELESGLEGGLRLASNVRLLSQGAGAALPQVLRAQGGKQRAAPCENRTDLMVSGQCPSTSGDISRLRMVHDRCANHFDDQITDPKTRVAIGR